MNSHNVFGFRPRSPVIGGQQLLAEQRHIGRCGFSGWQQPERSQTGESQALANNTRWNVAGLAISIGGACP